MAQLRLLPVFDSVTFPQLERLLATERQAHLPGLFFAAAPQAEAQATPVVEWEDLLAGDFL